MTHSLIGTTVDGYRIVDVIGRGGMGTVYKAVDEALDKVVALKMMAPRLAEDATFLERFKSEAKALARLDAPGIVRVIALRETEHGLFIVMEYVDGRTLSTLMQRHAPLDWREALPLLRQMLEAIAHAHDSDVLHRDLKPSNILVTDDGSVKVMDFGLAKIQASDAELTSTYETAGTLHYMSPEQIKGLRNVDERSDLFSLGLIFYEMLTGRLPFDRSASNYSIQHAIVEEAFPTPTNFRSDIPDELAAVIQRMLAKEQHERFPDAHAVLDALRPIEEQLTSPASPPNWAPSTSTSIWRRVALGVAFGIAGLLLLGGSFYTIRSLLQPPTPPGSTQSSANEPPPPRARLSVTSTPSGAVVYLNGDSLGTTPLDTVRPSSSTASIRLTKANFQSFDTTLAATGDEVLTVSLTPVPAPEEPTERSIAADRQRASSDRTSAATTSSDSSAAATPPASLPQPSDEPDDEPTTGTLVVTSEPSGADVSIDGQPRGQTPLTVPTLDRGAHAVLIQADDYEPFRTTATLQGGDTLRLAPTLRSRPAVLRVRVIPYGSIAIDGTPRLQDADVALTDTLAPGTHRLRATYRNLTWERSITLFPGEETERIIDFTKTIDVGVTAETADGARLPNAEVLVDGEMRGYAPLQFSLRVGTHTLTVRKEGYEPAERTVTVDEQLQGPIVFQLRRTP